MRFRDCMIAWQPKGGQSSNRTAPDLSVEVGLCWPADTSWAKPYQSTCGACMSGPKHWTAARCAFQAMLDFNTLVVRDGLDPEAVHSEFLKIDEYRFHISRDAKGAEDWPDWYEREYNNTKLAGWDENA